MAKSKKKKHSLATLDAPKNPSKRRLSMSHVLAVSSKLRENKKGKAKSKTIKTKKIR